MLSLKANDVQWKNTFIYGYSVCEARNGMKYLRRVNFS